MPLETEIEIDQATADAFFSAVNSAADRLGKSMFDSLQWGARYLCTSLSGQTKQATNRPRPIVQNPDDRWKTDRRRAPFGVMGYKNGQPMFKPIFRSGEYGTYRFYSRRTMSWYDRSGGPGQWRTINTGPDIANPELVLPGLYDSPKRLIPRRGLAKQAWRSARSLVGTGGMGNGLGISNIARVNINASETDPSVKLDNLLKYAGDAFRAGDASINIAMNRATNSLLHNIQRKRDQQLGLDL